MGLPGFYDLPSLEIVSSGKSNGKIDRCRRTISLSRAADDE